MSNRFFVKGKCLHCSGPLSFPADAAGDAIECPHCGKTTELTLPASVKARLDVLLSPGQTENQGEKANKVSSPLPPPQPSSRPPLRSVPGWEDDPAEEEDSSDENSDFEGLPRKTILAVLMVLLIAGIIVPASLLWHRKPSIHPATVTAPPAPIAQIKATTQTLVAIPPPPKYQNVTNDFAILSFKMEKTPGSSLVYVTGTVRNLSDRQRFGVKMEFDLFDAQDRPAGTATDYQSELDPHGDWSFKALVMESKAVSARFHSIAEDK